MGEREVSESGRPAAGWPVERYARWLRDAQPGAVTPPPSFLGLDLGAGDSIGIALLLRDAEAGGFVAVDAASPIGRLAVRTAAPIPPRWNPIAAARDAFERALPLMPAGAAA